MPTSGETWQSDTAHRLQILSDEFDSRLEPIALDIYTKWLLTQRTQAHFAISPIRFRARPDQPITLTLAFTAV